MALERRKGLARRTPLAPGQPLRRTSGLRSSPIGPGGEPGGAIKKGADGPRAREPRGAGAPPKPKSKAPQIPAKLRKLVIERSEHSCDRCGRNLIGQPYSLQHRRARGSGGRRDGYLDTAANLVVVCGSATTPGSCHEWLERRSGRTTESSQGFVIRGEIDRPEDVPILRHGVEWLIPHESGWLPAEPIADQAA